MSFDDNERVAEIHRLQQACAAKDAEIAALKVRIDELELMRKNYCSDWAEDDTAIRKMCRGIISDEFIDGDSYGVPTAPEVAEEAFNKLKERIAELDKECEVLAAELTKQTEKAVKRIAAMEALLDGLPHNDSFYERCYPNCPACAWARMKQTKKEPNATATPTTPS